MTRDELILARDDVLCDIGSLGEVLLKNACHVVLTNEMSNGTYACNVDESLAIYKIMVVRLWKTLDEIEAELSEYEKVV